MLVFFTDEEVSGVDKDHVLYCLTFDMKWELWGMDSVMKPDINPFVVYLPSVDIHTLLEDNSYMPKEIADKFALANKRYLTGSAELYVNLMDEEYRSAMKACANSMNIESLQSRISGIEEIGADDYRRWEETERPIRPNWEGFISVFPRTHMALVDTVGFKGDEAYSALRRSVQEFFVLKDGNTSRAPYDFILNKELLHINPKELQYFVSLMEAVGSNWAPPRDISFLHRFDCICGIEDVREAYMPMMFKGDEEEILKEKIMMEAVRLFILNAIRSMSTK